LLRLGILLVVVVQRRKRRALVGMEPESGQEKWRHIMMMPVRISESA
jgi:hypothetical protein